MKKSSEKIETSIQNKKSIGIGDRLSNAIQSTGYKSAIDFARKYGIKRSTLYYLLNNRTKNPSVKLLDACRRAGINPYWLIYGDGEMLLSINESNFQTLSDDRLKSFDDDGIISLVNQGLLLPQRGLEELERRGRPHLAKDFKKSIPIKNLPETSGSELSMSNDPTPDAGPGFEKRREIAQLLVQLDVDNLWQVRKFIDALIADMGLKK